MHQIPILALTLLFALSGCSSPLNDRITLGGAYTSPTFENEPTKASQSPAHIKILSAPPIARASWSTTKYIAPFDGTVHTHDLVVSSIPQPTASPRLYGRFPTVNNVLTVQSTSWIDDLLFMVTEYGRTFIGTPYAATFLAATGQWNEPDVSPHQIWKRTHSPTWSSGYPTPKCPHTKDSTEDPKEEDSPHDQ